jgi:subfamily B ATP-binding cassette protein MsbA
VYRRLLQFLRPHKWRMIATIACNLIAAFLDVFSFTLLIPFLRALFGLPALETGTSVGNNVTKILQTTVGRFIDDGDPMGSLRNVILVILVAITLKNIFVWLGGQIGAQLQEYVTRDLRNALYSHLQRLPLRFYQRMKVGQVLSRVLVDTLATKQLITEMIARSLQSAAQIIATIVALLSISPQLTLMALVIVPALILALQPLLRKLRKGHRRLSNEQGELTSIVQESVSGIRLVKSFGAEDHEEGRFVDASNRFASGLVRVNRIAYLSQPITETLGTVLAVALLWIGARQVLVSHTLDGANLITFLIMVLRMLQPFKQLSQVPTTAQQSMASAERIFEVLDQPTEAQLDAGTKSPAAFGRAMVFDRVSFSYGDAPVLSDISFTAGKGQVVALVGASGAGKSTLVDLIPRFMDPTAGRITIDGTDVREYRLGALRALTGIVSQDTVLFNDTVRANIAFGAPGVYSDAQVEAAARAANAHGFISELPQGYETVLGERGTRLSGGQRQRLAIARALLVDPPILILDEATSALDTESERLVQQAIDRLLEGRTVFVIAHRLSTIVHADQILVLDRGRLVEQGTHAELLSRGGVYARLHAAQFERADAGRVPAATESSEDTSRDADAEVTA